MDIDEVSRSIEPSIEERRRVDAIASEAINLVREASKQFREVKEVLFGGSYAKDTWLTNDVDIDIFVKVASNTSSERFEYIGKTLGLIALKDHMPYLKYAQHPYVEAIIDGIRINVVPCYDVKKGEWQSAVDRSIYHTQFINEKFDEKMRREVRILKRFMRSIKVYGAEIAINGFSGYVCEVLILKYNTFINTLKNASKFKEGDVISIYDYDKSILDLFDTPLIILDPIDTKRNLGAAISSKSVAKFILASRAFLSNPSLKFFKELKTIPNDSLRDNIIAIEFNYEDRSEDIVWGEAKHSMKAIAKQLMINDFKVVRASCDVDINKKNVTFAFLLEDISISEYYVKEGPKVFNEQHTDKFLNANKDAEMLWIDDTRIMSLKKRRHNDAYAFLNILLRDKIEKSGISKGIIRDIKQGFTIHKSREKLISKIIDDITGTDELLQR